MVLSFSYLGKVRNYGEITGTRNFGHLRVVFVVMPLFFARVLFRIRLIFTSSLLLFYIFDIESHLIPLIDFIHQEHHELCPLHGAVAIDVDLQKHEHQPKNEVVILSRTLFDQLIALILEVSFLLFLVISSN